MKVYHQIFVYDKNEKFKRRTRKVRSRSFLKPFLYQLCPDWGGSSISTIDITNTARTFSADPIQNVTHAGLISVSGLFNRSSITNSTWNTATNVGIQVGTGTNAVAITDYKLQTQIANGTSANQLVYLGTWVFNMTVGASSASFDIERIFYNGSGGSITINEIGLYSSAGYIGDFYCFCIIRDKLSSGVTVANTEHCKVKYTITVSV